MTTCCIKFCGQNTKNFFLKQSDISFYRFPKDPILREKWVEASGRQYWLPTHFSVVCSRHFAEDCFSATCRRILLDTAIPTLHLPFDNAPSTQNQEVKKQEAENDGVRQAPIQVLQQNAEQVLEEGLELLLVPAPGNNQLLNNNEIAIQVPDIGTVPVPEQDPVQCSSLSPEHSLVQSSVQSPDQPSEQSSDQFEGQSTAPSPEQSPALSPEQSSVQSPEQSQVLSPEQSPEQSPVQSSAQSPKQDATETPENASEQRTEFISNLIPQYVPNQIPQYIPNHIIQFIPNRITRFITAQVPEFITAPVTNPVPEYVMNQTPPEFMTNQLPELNKGHVPQFFINQVPDYVMNQVPGYIAAQVPQYVPNQVSDQGPPQPTPPAEDINAPTKIMKEQPPDEIIESATQPQVDLKKSPEEINSINIKILCARILDLEEKIFKKNKTMKRLYSQLCHYRSKVRILEGTVKRFNEKKGKKNKNAAFRMKEPSTEINIDCKDNANDGNKEENTSDTEYLSDMEEDPMVSAADQVEKEITENASCVQTEEINEVYADNTNIRGEENKNM